MSVFPAPVPCITVPLAELPANFQRRALSWAAAFPHCAYFEPNDLDYPNGPFSRILAVAPAGSEAVDSLTALATAQQQANAPLCCGFITYDAKNAIEQLESRQFSGFHWPELHFFRPQTWL